MAGFIRDVFVFDVGSSMTRIGKVGSGLLLREPTVAAIDINGDGHVIEAGKKAVLLHNRFPNGIRLISPFKAGRLIDGNLLTATFKKLLESNNERFTKSVSRYAVVPVRNDLSKMGVKTLLDAVRLSISGGARDIPSVVCAAYASGAHMASVRGGTLVIDMGTKKTDAAIMFCGEVCSVSSVAFGAEDINLYCAYRKNTFDALRKSIAPIINMIEDLFINTMPELVGDIINTGVYISGGGSNIFNIDKAFSEYLGVDVYIDDTGSDAVILGGLLMHGENINRTEKKKTVSI